VLSRDPAHLRKNWTTVKRISYASNMERKGTRPHSIVKVRRNLIARDKGRDDY